MHFHGPLYRAVLDRRYKRFLADMHFENGEEILAHCPNPGAMTGLATPGATCWIARSKAGAKLDWGWKITETADGARVFIDTGAANAIVAEALQAGLLADLAEYTQIRPETRFGADSRIDFCLEGPYGRCWIEVKSVSLRHGQLGAFPDSKTLRGAKHLKALQAAKAEGDRAITLYLLVRDDCEAVAIADHIDPAYAEAFRAARAAGVEMRAMACNICPEQGVKATREIPMLGLIAELNLPISKRCSV